MDKIISSFFKASIRCLVGFSECVIILALSIYCIDENIEPKSVFIFAWMFLSIDIILTIELSMQSLYKWAKVPYYIKKLIFMPFYMAIIVTGTLGIEQISNNIKNDSIFILSIAVIVYIIFSFVNFNIEKKSTDKMNDALVTLQKELEKENEEG